MRYNPKVRSIMDLRVYNRFKTRSLLKVKNREQYNVTDAIILASIKQSKELTQGQKNYICKKQTEFSMIKLREKHFQKCLNKIQWIPMDIKDLIYLQTVYAEEYCFIKVDGNSNFAITFIESGSGYDEEQQRDLLRRRKTLPRLFFLSYNNELDVILSIVGYMSRHKFCEQCLIFHKPRLHKCRENCRICDKPYEKKHPNFAQWFRAGSDESVRQDCPDCNRTCYSLECYEVHKTTTCKKSNTSRQSTIQPSRPTAFLQNQSICATTDPSTTIRTVS
jgi:hypothetical protein